MLWLTGAENGTSQVIYSRREKCDVVLSQAHFREDHFIDQNSIEDETESETMQMAPQMVVRHPITLTFGTKHVHVLIHEGFLQTFSEGVIR